MPGALRSRAHWLALASGALLLAVLVAAPLARRWMARAASAPWLGQVPPFALVDQRARAFSRADLAGKLWVADFIFTSCQGACPMLSTRMRALQGWIAEAERARGAGDLGVRLVSFSVDPEVDTPERLAAYAERWGADARLWTFVTGSLDEVTRVATSGMKAPIGKPSRVGAARDMAHGERLVLVDRRAFVRGQFAPTPEGLADLERTLSLLLAETP